MNSKIAKISLALVATLCAPTVVSAENDRNPSKTGSTAKTAPKGVLNPTLTKTGQSNGQPTNLDRNGEVKGTRAENTNRTP